MSGQIEDMMWFVILLFGFLFVATRFTHFDANSIASAVPTLVVIGISYFFLDAVARALSAELGIVPQRVMPQILLTAFFFFVLKWASGRKNVGLCLLSLLILWTTDPLFALAAKMHLHLPSEFSAWMMVLACVLFFSGVIPLIDPLLVRSVLSRGRRRWLRKTKNNTNVPLTEEERALAKKHRDEFNAKHKKAYWQDYGEKAQAERSEKGPPTMTGSGAVRESRHLSEGGDCLSERQSLQSG